LFDDAQPDLPLRDTTPGVEPALSTERELFTTSSRPPLAEPPRRRGLRMWFVAAASLVAGIVIGFASGYNAGLRVPPSIPTSVPSDSASAASDDGTKPGQTFSEGAVSEPTRVDPEPIVPAPPPEPVKEAPRSAPAPEPRRAPPVAAAPTGPGSLQVVSRPSGAQVMLDGRAAGRTPLVISNVRAGAHDVRSELPGFRRWSTSVRVEPGARARVAASLEQ
jgi:hypothetical protein